MNAADRRALAALAGSRAADRATTDDLQALLLQVVFALLMIFMIAYFIFVSEAKEEREEAVMELNRQKLVLALEKTAEDYRARYGVNALMTEGNDGKRTFEAADFVDRSRLSLPPAAQRVFAVGAAAASDDYADEAALLGAWRAHVEEVSGLKGDDLSRSERTWLEAKLAASCEAVRLDVRGMQRALAAELQRAWIADPEAIDDPTLAATVRRLDAATPEERIALAGEISDVLRIRSLHLVSEAAGAPMLP